MRERQRNWSNDGSLAREDVLFSISFFILFLHEIHSKLPVESIVCTCVCLFACICVCIYLLFPGSGTGTIQVVTTFTGCEVVPEDSHWKSLLQNRIIKSNYFWINRKTDKKTHRFTIVRG